MNTWLPYCWLFPNQDEDYLSGPNDILSAIIWAGNVQHSVLRTPKKIQYFGVLSSTFQHENTKHWTLINFHSNFSCFSMDKVTKRLSLSTPHIFSGALCCLGFRKCMSIIKSKKKYSSLSQDFLIYFLFPPPPSLTVSKSFHPIRGGFVEKKHLKPRSKSKPFKIMLIKKTINAFFIKDYW